MSSQQPVSPIEMGPLKGHFVAIDPPIKTFDPETGRIDIAVVGLAPREKGWTLAQLELVGKIAVTPTVFKRPKSEHFCAGESIGRSVAGYAGTVALFEDVTNKVIRVWGFNALDSYEMLSDKQITKRTGKLQAEAAKTLYDYFGVTPPTRRKR